MKFIPLTKSATFRPLTNADSGGTNLKCECGARCTLLTTHVVQLSDSVGKVVSRHYCCRKCGLVLTEYHYDPPQPVEEQVEEPMYHHPLPPGITPGPDAPQPRRRRPGRAGMPPRVIDETDLP